MIFFRWCVSRCFYVFWANFWILAGCQKSIISNYNLSYNSQFSGSAPGGILLEGCLASLGVFYQIFDFPCFCLYSGPWQAAVTRMSDSLFTWRGLHFLCAILSNTVLVLSEFWTALCPTLFLRSAHRVFFALCYPTLRKSSILSQWALNSFMPDSVLSWRPPQFLHMQLTEQGTQQISDSEFLCKTNGFLQIFLNILDFP